MMIKVTDAAYGWLVKQADQNGVKVGEIVEALISRVAAPKPSAAQPEKRGGRNECQQWLVDYLLSQPGYEAIAQDVIAAGREAGYSDMDVRNARQRCKSPRIISEQIREGRTRTIWRISGPREDQDCRGWGTAHSTPAPEPAPEPKLGPEPDLELPKGTLRALLEPIVVHAYTHNMTTNEIAAMFRPYLTRIQIQRMKHKHENVIERSQAWQQASR